MEDHTAHNDARHGIIPTCRKVEILRPRTRRGKGPGLLLILSDRYGPPNQRDLPGHLDPEPLEKWAEEGFAVAQVQLSVDHLASRDILRNLFSEALESLARLPECEPNGKIGVVVYNLGSQVNGEYSILLWECLQELASVVAIVSFMDYTTGPHPRAVPVMAHNTSGSATTTHADVIHGYQSVSSTNFILPSHKDYVSSHSSVAHTRSLGFLKRYLEGPCFNLEAIWNEHTMFEFGERDVQKTMATMVEEPYVNHIPTMTGGIGRSALTNFYRDHFIFNNPEDTSIELVSRTVGVDRVIDEFIFSFTHTKIIDWLVPGIPPTGQAVRVPFTSVVNIRGDRLYHEHIAWDQASVLRQLGLLPDYLPFPYPLPDGRLPATGKRFEYRVPTAGADTARKLLDELSIESNTMFEYNIREVNDV